MNDWWSRLTYALSGFGGLFSGSGILGFLVISPCMSGVFNRVNCQCFIGRNDLSVKPP